MKVDAIQMSQPNYSAQSRLPESQTGADIEENNYNDANTVAAVATEGKSIQDLLDKQKVAGSGISISEKAIIDAIERANKAVQGINTSFEYSIHEKTREIMVKVVNRDTKEVIREIPPEKILDMVAKMWEMAGLFVDEKK